MQYKKDMELASLNQIFKIRVKTKVVSILFLLPLMHNLYGRNYSNYFGDRMSIRMEEKQITDDNYQFSFVLPYDFDIIKRPFANDIYDWYLFVDCSHIYKKVGCNTDFFTIAKYDISGFSNRDSIIGDDIERTISSSEGKFGTPWEEAYWLNFGIKDSFPYYVASSFSPYYKHRYFGKDTLVADSLNARILCVLFMKQHVYSFTFYTITSIYNFPYSDILRIMDSIRVKEIEKKED